MTGPSDLPGGTPFQELGLDPNQQGFDLLVVDDLADEHVDLGFMGLACSDSVEQVAYQENVQYRRVARPREQLLAHLAELLRDAPDIKWLEPPGSTVSVGRWSEDRELVVVVPRVAGSSTCHGDAYGDPDQGRFLLGGGKEEGWFCHVTATGHTVVQVSGTKLRAWHCPSGQPGKSLLRAADDSALPAIPPPAEVFPGLELQPWLDKATAELSSSPSLVDRAAALGMTARLQHPHDPSGALAQELENPSTAPPAVLRSWLASAPVPLLDELQVQAEADTLGAMNSLGEDLQQLLEHEDPRDLLLLAHKRDRLESVRVVLAMAGRGDNLGELLAALDRKIVRGAPLASFAALDTSLLWAVATTEPHHWWGSQLVDCR